MADIPAPSRPIGVYKAIIDQLVNEFSQSISERNIRERGIYTKGADESGANALVQSLTLDQQNVLAKMFQQERISAIHDVLALLTWWMCCRGVALTYNGEPMPFELSGMGLHGDYIGRMDGWQWPSEEDESHS